MNRKGLYFGLAYSAAVIIFKLIILLGGYSLTRFGFFYSNVIGVFMIIPFYYLAIKLVRDKENGGIIAGKEAVRIALTIFVVAAILVSIYNYFEYEMAGKQLAIEYYNSQQFLDFLKTQPKIEPSRYPAIIAEQIQASEVSAFKATTGKLFSFMLLGLSSAFITSLIMKKSPK